MRTRRMLPACSLIGAALIPALAGGAWAQGAAGAAVPAALSESFEADPVQGWTLIGDAKTVAEGGGRVLVTNGFAFGAWDTAEQTDFALKLRYRHADGIGDIVLRTKVANPPPHLYHVLLANDRIAVVREEHQQQTELGDSDIQVQPGQWYDIAIAVAGQSIQVSVGGRLLISATDPNPLPPGVIALGSLVGNGFAYDEITLTAAGAQPSASVPGELRARGSRVPAVIPVPIPMPQQVDTELRVAGDVAADDGKDSLTPILVNLIERHLAGTPAQTDLDKVFRQSLQARGGIDPATLRKIADGFRAMSAQERTARFVVAASEPSPARPITIADAGTVLVGGAAGAGAPGAEPGRALGAPWASNELPHIDKLLPAPEGAGYIPESIITIVGRNFSPYAQNNGIILGQPASPNVYIPVQAISATETEIMFQLPANLGTALLTMHVVVGKPGKLGTVGSNTVTLRAYTPPEFYKPRITKVWPDDQKPGQGITIDGERFDPALEHTVLMRNISLNPERPYTPIRATFVSPTQLKAKIPLDASAGTHEVQVSTYKGASNTSELRVSSFEYRIVLNEIKCLDETNDVFDGEAGDDDIITVSLVLADGKAWAKSTGEYTFDEPDEVLHKYNVGDSMLLDWTPVDRLLVLSLQVWETDKGDTATGTKIIGVVGDVASAISSGIWGAEVGSKVGKVIQFIGKAWETVAGWLGLDDVRILGGEKRRMWPQPTLAGVVAQGKSTSEWVDFDAFDGHYQVRYTLYCK